MRVSIHVARRRRQLRKARRSMDTSLGYLMDAMYNLVLYHSCSIHFEGISRALVPVSIESIHLQGVQFTLRRPVSTGVASQAYIFNLVMLPPTRGMVGSAVRSAFLPFTSCIERSAL